MKTLSYTGFLSSLQTDSLCVKEEYTSCNSVIQVAYHDNVEQFNRMSWYVTPRVTHPTHGAK